MNITLNGTTISTTHLTAKELSTYLYPQKDIVIIVNGFQVDSDCALNENDIITLIEKGTMPSQDILENMMAARHTPFVHSVLKQSKVAIAGLGGLGSNIAAMLARIGVGHLLLVDFDIVEPSNLNRQNYGINHLGMAKTLATKEQIENINPFITVETANVKVEENNIETLFTGYDIICEAFDKAEYKAMLVNTALDVFPDTKIVSGSGMAGYATSNTIQTCRKMKRLYVCGDLENEAGFGNGLMAPRVQICAGHQANMILRLLLGIEDV